jgi:HPt (histidine-containing phosphotransfer) domain-containing protein
LKPPKDVEADNTKLASALSGLASVFNNMKQALAAKDVSKIQQLAQSIQTSPAVTNAKSATDDLKKKGYDIGVLGQ